MMTTIISVFMYFVLGGIFAKSMTVKHFSTTKTFPSRSRISEFFIERTIFWPLFIVKYGVDGVVTSIENNLTYEIQRQKEQNENARIAEETFRKLGI